MGDHNITSIVTLRHHRNILFTIDVVPGVRVIDIVVICTGGGGTDTAELDGRGMDACSGGISAMRSMEGLSRRGRIKSIC